LHLRQIKTIDKANAVLTGGFIDNLNKKFEKPASNPESAHRPLGSIDLNQVFCWEYSRQIQHDSTFSFTGKYYQVEKKYGSCIKPKTYITVRKHMDGSISIWHGETRLTFTAIDSCPSPLKEQQPDKHQSKKLSKPSPWHESNNFLFQKVQSLLSKTTLRKRDG